MLELLDRAKICKRCACCNEYKELDTGFHRNKASKDGYCDECKSCRCKKQREYARTHREQQNARRRRWEERLKDTQDGRKRLRIRGQKASQRHMDRYYSSKSDKVAKARRTSSTKPKKWTTAEIKRIKAITAYVREAIHKRVPYTDRSQKYAWFSCTYEELHSHLGERPLGWELDHICPLSQATTVTEYCLLQHHLNLRWVPPEVNLQKGAGRSPAGEGLCLFILGRAWKN